MARRDDAPDLSKVPPFYLRCDACEIVFEDKKTMVKAFEMHLAEVHNLVEVDGKLVPIE